MTPARMTQVSWYEDLPSSWVTTRIKSVSRRVTDGAHISPDTNGGAFNFVSTRDLKDGAIDFAGSLKTSPATYEYMVRTGCKPWRGDLLFSKDGTVGTTALVDDDHDFVVASSLIIVSPNLLRILPRFLLHSFSARPVIEQARTMTRGAGLPRLSVGNLARIEIPLPSLDEQRAIADFLDRETAQIDALITRQNALIETLRERRAAVVDHIVWSGVTPASQQSLTGVETAPLAPRHWARLRNKNVFMERTDVSKGGEEELLTVSHITGVTPRSEKNVTMFEAESLQGYRIVRVGDLAINTMWAWMGALGVAACDGIVSPSYGVYRPRAGVPYLGRFFDYFYRSTPYVAEMTRNSRGITSSRLRLYPDVFLRLLVVVPPLKEQEQIAAYLDEQTGKIDALIAKTQQHIELAGERRTALITAAVTGQFNVRTARKAG